MEPPSRSAKAGLRGRQPAASVASQGVTSSSPGSLDETRPRPGRPVTSHPPARSALPLKAPFSSVPSRAFPCGASPRSLRWRLRNRVRKAQRRLALPFANGVAAAVGRTPLIKLKRASEETGCTILGKAEFMNPGQSVKDRAALFIIRDALNSGRLQPGGTVVEGTAGNTGIGLALVGNALGLKTVIVIPETQSAEKKDMLRLAGANLIEVPAVPYKDPNNYVKYSGRLAEELASTEPNGAIWANQFDNVANRQGHIETTAVEIWNDTQGKIDGFICAVGTGGTLAGVSMGLKARNKGIIIGIADTFGAALYN